MFAKNRFCVKSFTASILLFGSILFMPVHVAYGSQASLDTTAISTFTKYLSKNTWTKWSSTSDLFDQKSPGKFGTRFIPKACSSAHTQYPALRVLSQVGKLNDAIDAAGNVGNAAYTHQGSRKDNIGVSNAPVLATNNTFLRYEILLNRTAYKWMLNNKFYKAATLETWKSDLIFPLKSQVIKNAWVEYTGTNVKAQTMYTESMLVYTPANFNGSKKPSCLKKTMALVGQHLVTKTSANPAWTWATFEHNNSAPLCTTTIPGGNAAGIYNKSCPTTQTTNYIVNPLSANCGSGGCASCNVIPTKNASCKSASGYCVDAPVAQKSKLCRQVRSLAAKAAGSNYSLISTQWYNGGGTGDINNAPTVRQKANRGNYRPTTSGGNSVLGNTSMESYERSNCLGCHSQSVYNKTTAAGKKISPQISTDFMFWVTVEVPCGANGNNKACMDPNL